MSSSSESYAGFYLVGFIGAVVGVVFALVVFGAGVMTEHSLSQGHAGGGERRGRSGQRPGPPALTALPSQPYRALLRIASTIRTTSSVAAMSWVRTRCAPLYTATAVAPSEPLSRSAGSSRPVP